MPINKIVASFDEAVADIQDGAVLLVGGFGPIASIPSYLLEAVARRGVKNLTIVSNTAGFGKDIWANVFGLPYDDLDLLTKNGQVKKTIVSAPISQWIENTWEKKVRAGEIEVEMVAQGTLAERIRAARAGLGGFYTYVGAGTALEEGKETKKIDGRKYLLEYPIKADFGLIKAHKGDRWGNLVYSGTSRTFNATMAGAAKVTIAEVDQIVELGELDPEAIVTPGLYVDRVVERPREEREAGKWMSEEEKESQRKWRVATSLKEEKDEAKGKA